VVVGVVEVVVVAVDMLVVVVPVDTVFRLTQLLDIERKTIKIKNIAIIFFIFKSLKLILTINLANRVILPRFAKL
jgi:hypothetical protein